MKLRVAVLIVRMITISRAMVAGIGVIGTLTLAGAPQYWTMMHSNGETNWLPISIIACLIAALLELIRMPTHK